MTHHVLISYSFKRKSLSCEVANDVRDEDDTMKAYDQWRAAMKPLGVFDASQYRRNCFAVVV